MPSLTLVKNQPYMYMISFDNHSNVIDTEQTVKAREISEMGKLGIIISFSFSIL